MPKLVIFDAETLSTSLEESQPRPQVGVGAHTFGSLSPSFFTFKLQIFYKTLHCTTTSYKNWHCIGYVRKNLFKQKNN